MYTFVYHYDFVSRCIKIIFMYIYVPMILRSRFCVWSRCSTISSSRHSRASVSQTKTHGYIIKKIMEQDFSDSTPKGILKKAKKFDKCITNPLDKSNSTQRPKYW